MKPAAEHSGKQDKSARPRALPAGVEINGVALRGLQYIEDTKTATNSEEWPNPGAIGLTGRLVPQSAHTVEFLLETRVTAKGNDESFGLFIAMSALFTRQAVIETRPFIEFLNRQGGPILFPYIRELVGSITSRSIYDTLTMAPIVLEPLLDEQTIDGIIANVDALSTPEIPTR